MRIATTGLFAAAVLAFQPSPALARNILVTNDDGLTSNVVALYRALKAAGHDVIVAVPCTNQSGTGASLGDRQPLGPLAAPCLNNAAAAGNPGAGPMTRADLAGEAFHYVNATPVVAVLYGMAAAQERWNGAPDLVLSGPNEGQNVGAIVLSSGTVSAAQFAAVHGIPAIALSAGANTGDKNLANPLSAVVARLSVTLVDALEDNSGGGRLLPAGLALNVNFPDDPAGAQWRLSRIGSYNAYRLGFNANMAEDAPPMVKEMARERGVALPALPGLSFAMNEAEPQPGEENDEALVYRRHIAISPMQAGYGFGPAGTAFLEWQLAELLADESD